MLTSKQRSFLSGLAASLQPTVMIGKEGLSEGVVRALQNELNVRELVKLRFIASKEDRLSFSEQLAQEAGAELVRVIGNVAIFYKMAEDAEKRTITLP
ncbi:MAG TPA: YhbY family RNA-binding protein [Treponema sp.]|nr:YhbY family RNA-binding protein [Treponema sp.]HPC71385.1 YhbY family RNA-binding protein [Treponema sp.]HRS03717.1 YhbY family RNA-binding protein [Treponema sp.]HRU28462.1 YhbY family RNA-binding protein [Treponema sp.]